MGEWQPARLIPTSGISGPDEQETRATSAFLVVLPVAQGYALATGAIKTFLKVPIETSDGHRFCRFDHFEAKSA